MLINKVFDSTPQLDIKNVSFIGMLDLIFPINFNVSLIYDIKQPLESVYKCNYFFFFKVNIERCVRNKKSKHYHKSNQNQSLDLNKSNSNELQVIRNGIKCRACYYDDGSEARIRVEKLEENIFRLRVFPSKTGKLRLRIEHHEEVLSNRESPDLIRSESSCTSLNKSVTIFSTKDLTRGEEYDDDGSELADKYETTSSSCRSSA